MLETIISILKNAISITFFVLAMMLFIEYINVKTTGAFSKRIRKNGFQQILLGTLLGAIPGCIGTYTVVTLFTHNLVSFGALTATFIATMGDEAFFLFSIRPKEAVIITALLFIIGLVSGVLVDFFSKNKLADTNEIEHFKIHEDETTSKQAIIPTLIANLKHSSPHRTLILVGLLLIFTLSILGEIGHSHDLISSFMVDEHLHSEHTHSGEHHEETNWLGLSFAFISLGIAYIISIVNEHFLEEHFWNHVIKKHFLKILLWTTAVIALVHVLNSYIHIQDLLTQYKYQILIVAVLVGLIPESGPHVIFLSLYVSGAIPMSILLANSIVQDGHGALPLFAENKKAFIKVKLINLFIGFLVGIIGLQFS